MSTIPLNAWYACTCAYDVEVKSQPLARTTRRWPTRR